MESNWGMGKDRAGDEGSDKDRLPPDTLRRGMLLSSWEPPRSCTQRCPYRLRASWPPELYENNENRVWSAVNTERCLTVWPESYSSIRTAQLSPRGAANMKINTVASWGISICFTSSVAIYQSITCKFTVSIWSMCRISFKMQHGWWLKSKHQCRAVHSFTPTLLTCIYSSSRASSVLIHSGHKTLSCFGLFEWKE